MRTRQAAQLNIGSAISVWEPLSQCQMTAMSNAVMIK
jgi:hypothetical protein